MLLKQIFAREAKLRGQIYINTLEYSLLFTTKLSSARQMKNSQNPLNADQLNIYSYVQVVTNVNNS